MASNWMNECDDDFNDDEMTFKKAKKIIDVYENHHYGGYVYDSSDYKKAKTYMTKRRWP